MIASRPMTSPNIGQTQQYGEKNRGKKSKKKRRRRGKFSSTAMNLQSVTSNSVKLLIKFPATLQNNHKSPDIVIEVSRDRSKWDPTYCRQSDINFLSGSARLCTISGLTAATQYFFRIKLFRKEKALQYRIRTGKNQKDYGSHHELEPSENARVKNLSSSPTSLFKSNQQQRRVPFPRTPENYSGHDGSIETPPSRKPLYSKIISVHTVDRPKKLKKPTTPNIQATGLHHFLISWDIPLGVHEYQLTVALANHENDEERELHSRGHTSRRSLGEISRITTAVPNNSSKRTVNSHSNVGQISQQSSGAVAQHISNQISHLVKGLRPNTPHLVRLRLRNELDWSPASDILTIITDDANTPDAPTHFRVVTEAETQAKQEIDPSTRKALQMLKFYSTCLFLQWDAPPTNLPTEITAVAVFFSTDAGETWNKHMISRKRPIQTSCFIEYLRPDSPYAFSVAFENAAGWGKPATLFARTPLLRAPRQVAPPDVIGVSTNEVHLSWVHSYRDLAIAYEVQLSSDGINWPNELKYKCFARKNNPSGGVEPTPEFENSGNNRSTLVRGHTSTVRRKRLQGRFLDNSEETELLLHDSATPFMIEGDRLYLAVGNLKASQPYHIRLKAQNAAGWGTLGSFRLCRTRPPMRPDEPFRPEILEIHKTSIVMALSPRYTGGSPILEFEIEANAQFPIKWGEQAKSQTLACIRSQRFRFQQKKNESASVSSNSRDSVASSLNSNRDPVYTVSFVDGLAPDTLYRFRVRARNIVGWSPFSAPDVIAQTYEFSVGEQVEVLCDAGAWVLLHKQQWVEAMIIQHGPDVPGYLLRLSDSPMDLVHIPYHEFKRIRPSTDLSAASDRGRSDAQPVCNAHTQITSALKHLHSSGAPKGRVLETLSSSSSLQSNRIEPSDFPSTVETFQFDSLQETKRYFAD
eukprot:g3699.t1